MRQLALAKLSNGDAEGAEEALRRAEDDPSGGIDQELLGHVRRLGGLIDDLTRNHRSHRTGERRSTLE
jgi:hypothetical protein